MNQLNQLLGTSSAPHPLRSQFMKWQCRVRQIAMREREGRPDSAITPDVYLPAEDAPMGAIITLISKSLPFSKTPEMQHMYKRTNDPAQRREKALQLFSEAYYQKAQEFSDSLTASFQPNSKGAELLAQAGQCRLAFEGYGHYFDLPCSVETLASSHALYQATWWHNALFNANLSPDAQILAFVPDWENGKAS
ncbi:MAG: hypothetical protein ACR2OJ_09495 [Hyphomicrobiales bacterium]